jgi:carbon-monoxide dehydrogenase medium subunit
MISSDFKYVAPSSVEEAVAELAKRGSAAVLAGGQSLITDLKLARQKPARLIDIGRIESLRGIDNGGGRLRIGATATLDAVEQAGSLAAGAAALSDAVPLIGDPQVRNRATVGGGIANRAAGADLPAVVLACAAVLAVAGPDGTRSVDVDDVFGAKGLQLGRGELMVAVRFASNGGRAYAKVANPGSGYAICGVAALVETGRDGKVSQCWVAVTGAGAFAMRLPAVEAALTGTSATADDIAQAAARVSSERIKFVSDVAATGDYRAHLTEVLSARSLTSATERARSTT